MSFLYKVEAFVEKDTKVEAKTNPNVLAIGDPGVNLFCSTTVPSWDELESGIAFLDRLIEEANKLRMKMLNQLAVNAKDRPPEVTINGEDIPHDKPFHLHFVEGCTACLIQRTLTGMAAGEVKVKIR